MKPEFSTSIPSIVFVQPHLQYGGAEKQTVLLANKLNEEGYQVTIILFDDSGPLVQQLAAEIQLIRVGYDRHELLFLTSFLLLRTLQAIRPSLVVIKLWSAITAVGLIEKMLKHHRFIYTEDLDPESHTSFIKFGQIKQKLVKTIFRRQEVLVTNSPIIAESMIRHYGLKIIPIVISPIVETGRASTADRQIQPTDFNIDADEPITIVSTGSLTKLKGYDVTLEALRRSKFSYRWIVFGEGPLRHYLESSSSANVEVLCRGSVPSPSTHYPPDAIFVHSSHTESFGVAIAEALVKGLPVVATETQGARHISFLTSGGAGFMKLVPIGSIPDLQREIEGFVHRGALTLEEKNSIINSSDSMSAPIIVSKWIDIFDDLYLDMLGKSNIEDR